MDTAQAPVPYLCKYFAFREVTATPARADRCTIACGCACVAQGAIEGFNVKFQAGATVLEAGGSMSDWVSRGWRREGRIMRASARWYHLRTFHWLCDARWSWYSNVKRLNNNPRKSKQIKVERNDSMHKSRRFNWNFISSLASSLDFYQIKSQVSPYNGVRNCTRIIKSAYHQILQNRWVSFR